MTTELILVGLVSLFASFLTFFSGFGLGTLLLPVFATFFPIETAITLTAIVHFFNNIFKTTLTYKDINFEILKRFGISSIFGAIIGSFVLVKLAIYFDEFNYKILKINLTTSLLKIIIGALIFAFTIVEFINLDKWINASKKTLFFGGIISGFFGGVLGHQGALRTLFLSKMNLDKFSFISSGIAIALIVDISRIPIYFSNFIFQDLYNGLETSIVAISTALIGAIIGKKFLKKIKLNSLYKVVSICLILFSIAFGAGFI